MRISDWSSDVCSSDLEAISYYEKGAALGNREAAAGFLRIALDPNYCSFCEDQGDLKFDRTKREAAGLLDKESGELSMAYRMEKTEVLAKAIRYATPVRLRAGDAAAHLLAAQYLTGVHYHWRSGIGITDAQKRSEEHTSELQSLMRNSY